MRNLLKAIEISRPLLWLNTSMPLLWGAIGLRGNLVLSDVVLFAFFLFPYNYFLHAPNDYFDFETDARNPRNPIAPQSSGIDVFSQSRGREISIAFSRLRMAPPLFSLIVGEAATLGLYAICSYAGHATQP